MKSISSLIALTVCWLEVD